MRLEGRTALVTGGASGIGAATARRLAAEGATVAVADLSEDGAREIAGEIDGFALTMDVTDYAAVRAGVAAAIAGVGELDVLVNNAGGGKYPAAFFVQTTEEQWDDDLRLNLHSVLAVTHAVLPAMQKRGSGAIVNVASEAGRAGSQASVPYSAAKAGVIGFTKAIAREGAHYGVRCNAVAPGPIETPLLEHLTEGGELGDRLRKGMIAATVMGRAGRAEEVAATIVFLASEDASFITGQTVGVSGGLTMW
jgi:2-hydroxycyclohexanecarboxyl-CoA dehydrogenase